MTDLDALEKLLAAATPRLRWANRLGIAEIVNALPDLIAELRQARRENYDLRDGQFVPALTAENERLRAENERLRAENERLAAS